MPSNTGFVSWCINIECDYFFIITFFRKELNNTMNAREILSIYNSVSPFVLEFETSLKSQQTRQISKLELFRSKVEKLSSISIFSAEILFIKQFDFFADNRDTLSIDPDDFYKISQAVDSINAGAGFLARYQASITSPDQDYTILLRLPEMSDFDGLSKVATELKKAIQLPIIDQGKDGAVKIQSAEPGSIWLSIYLGSFAAVRLVSRICTAAINLKKENARANMLVENAKMMGMLNEQLEMFNEVSKKHFETTLNREASSIINEEYHDNEDGKLERLKLAVNTFNDLIDKGTKVIALTQNVELKNQFPDFNPVNFLPSPPKQIGDSK